MGIRRTVLKELLSQKLIIAGLFAACLPLALQAGEYDFKLAGESNSRCFLTGSIRPINPSPGKQGFQSMENRIRMNFDADDAPTCERYIRSYCQNNLVARGDVPNNLTAYFRPAREPASNADTKPTHTYQVLESCKVIVD